MAGQRRGIVLLSGEKTMKRIAAILGLFLMVLPLAGRSGRRCR